MADQAIYSPQRVLDENGYPVAGAKVTFYAAGTLTLIDVWQDAAGTIAATNPVVADADGNLPQRFVSEEAKVVITDANDATLRTIDPVPVSLTSAGMAGLVTFSPTANIPAASVQAAIVMVDDNARAREAALEAALGTPLRVDAAQSLSGGEQTQGQSNLGLGTFATVSPTGTPDGSKFLRDDNSWQDLPDAPRLGVGQTWQDVTGSRSVSTTYQNTTGRPIMVIGLTSGSGVNRWQISSNGTTWLDAGYATSSSDNREVSFLVPDGWRYRINGTATIATWLELR